MDGIIIVNKPKGVSSNWVVNKVKNIFNCKVGHTGTLDPNATGVLPLLLGNGTKFSKYLINHNKKYCAVLKLGVKMSTADIEGDIIAKKYINEKIFDRNYLEKILASFKGKQIQTPPVYSAIKVNGKKLYEYARKGLEVDVPKRAIEIYNMELIDFNVDEKVIKFNVECSKGTYIRSLCESIAEKLDTFGYMQDLERLVVGNFKIEDSVTIDEIENNKDNSKWINKNVISFEDFLVDIPKIDIPKDKLEKFYNGVKLMVHNKDGLYKIFCNGVFIGSGIVQDGGVKRDIVLNNL